jgi:metal-responsive CopG/Arc/MetJ family transcriptional regulator
MTKNHPHPSGITTRPAMASPLSVSITTTQLQWIDQRRALGSLSRSAVIRQALDHFIALEVAQAPQPQQSGS